jgi:hypothetical protein
MGEVFIAACALSAVDEPAGSRGAPRAGEKSNTSNINKVNIIFILENLPETIWFLSA